MTSIRDRVNAHLPIVLQFLSSASLVAIAMSSICASQSLKEIAGSHEVSNPHQMHKIDMNYKK